MVDPWVVGAYVRALLRWGRRAHIEFSRSSHDPIRMPYTITLFKFFPILLCFRLCYYR